MRLKCNYVTARDSNSNNNINPLVPLGSLVWDMGVIKQHKVTPAVFPAALCAASRKKSRKSRIFSNATMMLNVI